MTLTWWDIWKRRKRKRDGWPDQPYYTTTPDTWRSPMPKPLGTTVAEAQGLEVGNADRVPTATEVEYRNPKDWSQVDDSPPTEEEWAEAAAAQGEWQDLKEADPPYPYQGNFGNREQIENPERYRHKDLDPVIDHYRTGAKLPDPVHSIVDPPYYKEKIIEPIDVIEDWDLPHHLACVIKYLARWDIKGDPTANLKKAKWYLERFLMYLPLRSDKQLGSLAHPCPGCGHPDNMECVQHRMETGVHIRSTSKSATNPLPHIRLPGQPVEDQ